MSTEKKARGVRAADRELLPMLEKQTGPLTFGMLLRVARSSLDLSQAELTRQRGISRGTLCDIEKGRQLVSLLDPRKLDSGKEIHR